MKSRSLSIALGICLISAGVVKAQFRQDDKTSMKQQAVNWFKKVNSGGPFGKMVPGVSRRIEEIIDEGKHVVVLVPARLTKTNKNYFGMTWAGLFFPLEMTSSQARAAGVAGGVTTYSTGSIAATRQSRPMMQIDHLKIDRSFALSGDRPISGQIFVRLFEPPTGKLVLRIGYKREGSTTYITKPIRDFSPEGLLSFRLDPVNRGEKKPHNGPLPFFVEICLDEGGRFDRKLKVVSNTLSRMLNVTSSKSSTGSTSSVSRFLNRTPSVAGTTWKFGGVSTTVTFLQGGNVKFSNSRYGGFWEQNGSKLKFDSNNFTLFEVTISGNEMKGKWRRLQGEDKGLTSSTSLSKLAGL